jgi:hypothetical protein
VGPCVTEIFDGRRHGGRHGQPSGRLADGGEAGADLAVETTAELVDRPGSACRCRLFLDPCSDRQLVLAAILAQNEERLLHAADLVIVGLRWDLDREILLGQPVDHPGQGQDRPAHPAPHDQEPGRRQAEGDEQQNAVEHQGDICAPGDILGAGDHLIHRRVGDVADEIEPDDFTSEPVCRSDVGPLSVGQRVVGRLPDCGSRPEVSTICSCDGVAQLLWCIGPNCRLGDDRPCGADTASIVR